MPGLDLETETVELEVIRRVAWITFNRPDTLNAWTREFARDLGLALAHAERDGEIRAIVLTGAGRAFSSGADLRAGGEFDADGKLDVLTLLRQAYNPLILQVRTLRKPVVAAVNGPAAGIGCSLALAADLIVAAQSAYFLLAFANIGLALDGGVSSLLSARAGLARASEMALLAERIPAPKALEWGLVNRVVPDEALAAVAGELAGRLASGPPASYAAIKLALNQGAYAQLAESLDLEARLQQQLIHKKDFVEGVTAFLHKRPAQFTGE
ncbi:MAG: enoyl-CoA hydratase/isomerase family protein [Solirubrobacteraceae bacterium]